MLQILLCIAETFAVRGLCLGLVVIRAVRQDLQFFLGGRRQWVVPGDDVFFKFSELLGRLGFREDFIHQRVSRTRVLRHLFGLSGCRPFGRRRAPPVALARVWASSGVWTGPLSALWVLAVFLSVAHGLPPYGV